MSTKFLAIVTISLVAGFSVETGIDFSQDVNSTFNYTLKAKYPFRQFKVIVAVDNGNISGTFTETDTLADDGVPRSAEFFVAWGVLTLFYCIIAVSVYMLVTANEQWEKAFDVLVVADIVFHIVWILCWFIASVAWVVAFNRLDELLNDYLDDVQRSYSQQGIAEDGKDRAIYIQAQVAMVFGFLMQFVWIVNIGWLVIDTSWYINWKARRGHTPL